MEIRCQMKNYVTRRRIAVQFVDSGQKDQGEWKELQQRRKTMQNSMDRKWNEILLMLSSEALARVQYDERSEQDNETMQEMEVNQL